MPSAPVFPKGPAAFAALAATALIFVLTLSAAARNTRTSIVKRQAAQAQLAKADEQRAILTAKAVPQRTLADYKQVVNAYRRVTLITPRAPEVQDSLMAIAELNTEMGDRFGRSYFQAAADTYQFLVHEYPASKYCPDASLRMARLQKDRLGDLELASKTYEDFLRLYPRSPHRREAQEALAELALLQREAAAGKEPARVASNQPPRIAGKSREPVTSVNSMNAAASAVVPHIKNFYSTAAPESTRIMIELDHKAEFSAARIANPDRIYFDIRAARLTKRLAQWKIPIDGKLVKAVRVAQNQSGIVRIVFEIAGVKDYSAFLTDDPPTLVIDFFGSGAAPRTTQAANSAPQEEISSEAVQPSVAKKAPADGEAGIGRDSVSPKPQVTAPVRDTLPLAGGKPSSKTHKSSSAAITPASAPQPTHDGQATLTRTLGLKISRIVIDPGHGGYDTGTIGPGGLMEKDLCLDVALRLGKIIEQRLPGAEVVYTRADDTFIPLEERTQIANEKKADLFLSIHANSSRDHAARGVETYYLNLKGSPEAMEVAARENATSQENVSDLQELVKKIARNEKIDESREFAEDIQDSLSRRIQRTSKRVINRGVRKAPFAVLIGANMPSVLAEISFLSNPSDEQLLKRGEYRQRLAEGLYQGVVSYLQSLNSVTYNHPARNAAAGRSGAGGAPTAVEQSRNQR